MRRILLVEDDADVRDLLNALLLDAGYDVATAGCLADGRAAMDTAAFDLLVANVVLPDGRGSDLATLGQERGIPALLVTGNPDRMTQFEARNVPYLRKPFRTADFLRAVEARFGPETE